MLLEFKIIITSVVVWFVAHVTAFPNSVFAEWGKSKFGSYSAFLAMLFIFLFILPIAICGILLLWKL